MRDLVEIFRFGWPYLKKYRGRLIAGVLLGILFGVSNASFLWATKTLFERIAGHKDRIVVAGNTRLDIIVDTNRLSEVLISSNGVISLIVSNEAVLKVLASTNPLPGGAVATYADPNAASPKTPGFASGFVKKFNATVDPWLPLMHRKIEWRQVVGGLLLLPILVALRGYIGYLSSYCMRWVSERVIRDLRIDLLNKLNSMSMDYFNRATMGEILMRVNGDTTSLYRCLSLGFSDLIKEPITILSLLAGLLWVNWKLTLMALVFTPLTVVPVRILGKKVREMLKSGVMAGQAQDSLLVEMFSSMRVVKAFCLENLQMQRFNRIFNNMVRIGMKSTQSKELVNPTVETLSMFGLGVVIIYIFTFGVTAPELVGFLTGVTMMFTPIKKLGALHIYFQQAGIGAQRLVEIFAQQPSVKEKPDGAPVPTFSRELKFEKVFFGYAGRPVLRNINFTISRGMKLGIAGESGCGKSTLVNLIFRFYDPRAGQVTIDGQDLRDVKTYDLRQQMALVSQEVVIFDQSVFENIACGRAGATREEVEAAAKAAYAHDFIMQMPKGYDTRLMERGVNLSVGQRQRISIARAFVRNAPILVLDEATAALDAKAEGEVQVAIDRLTENRTVICIAHRLSTLANMDKIIVLTEGKITEEGSFEDLLRAKKTFAEMARKQGMVSKDSQPAAATPAQAKPVAPVAGKPAGPAGAGQGVAPKPAVGTATQPKPVAPAVRKVAPASALAQKPVGVASTSPAPKPAGVQPSSEGIPATPAAQPEPAKAGTPNGAQPSQPPKPV
jgi:ABC-type multidrug transport system fused ATPase/permease subunit